MIVGSHLHREPRGIKSKTLAPTAHRLRQKCSQSPGRPRPLRVELLKHYGVAPKVSRRRDWFAPVRVQLVAEDICLVQVVQRACETMKRRPYFLPNLIHSQKHFNQQVEPWHIRRGKDRPVTVAIPLPNVLASKNSGARRSAQGILSSGSAVPNGIQVETSESAATTRFTHWSMAPSCSIRADDVLTSPNWKPPTRIDKNDRLPLASRGSETVADAAHGLDEVGLAPQLLPQRAHMDIDGALHRVGVLASRAVE